MLILPRRAAHKPAEGVGVNWSDPLTQGLVRLWLMNEGGGARLKDLVRGDDLVAAGTPGWGSGPRGPVTTYTNTVSTHYAVAAASPTLSGTFTVAFWAMQTTSNNATIFTTRTGSDHSFDMGFSGLTKFHGDVGDGASAWLSTAVDLTYATVLGLWYHVVTVITPTGWAVYASSPGKARGQASGGFSGTPVLWNATHTLQIGSGGSNNAHLIGAIDSVMVWNRALGADEVLQLANPHDLSFLQPLASPQRFWFFQQFKGTVAVAPPTPTLALAASEKLTATGTIAPPKSALAAVAAEKLGGTGAVGPPKATLSASGAETIATSGAVAPPTSSLVLAASESFGATVAESPPTADLAASGTETFAASGVVALGSNLAGSGGQQLDGAGGLAGESTLAANATERLAGEGAIVPPAAAVTATGDSVSGGATATGSGGIVAPGSLLNGQGAATPAHHGASGGRGTWRVGIAVEPPAMIVGAAKVVAPTPLLEGEGDAIPVIRGSGAVIAPAGRVLGHAAQRQWVAGHAAIESPLPTVGTSGGTKVVCVGAVTVAAVVDGRGLPLIQAIANVRTPRGRIDASGRTRRALWRQIEDDVLLGLLPEEELLRVA